MTPVTPAHVWLIELPDGWNRLPTDVQPDPLEAAVGSTPDGARPAAAALADLLRADRSAGAAALAWSGVNVAGTRFLAGHSVTDGLATRPPLDDQVALATAQPIELPRGPATLDVTVGQTRGVRMLQVVHTVEVPAIGRAFQLVGRSPHLGLADQVVRLFHLVASTFEVVTTEDSQPAVVRE